MALPTWCATTLAPASHAEAGLGRQRRVPLLEREPGAERHPFDQLHRPKAPAYDDFLQTIRRYRHAFREAFEEAAGALTPEARNVLRAHFVHARASCT
ncbi:MAG: hypothetical protein ACOC1F_08510 [Myxococcota bacterium]